MHSKIAVNSFSAVLLAVAAGTISTIVRAAPGPGPWTFRVTLAPATVTVGAGTSATLTVTLDKPAPDVLPLRLTTTGPAGVVACQSLVKVPAGQTKASFKVKGLSPGGPITVTATLPTAAGGASASAHVTVRGLSISLSPAKLIFTLPSTGKLTATLSAPAPVGGVNISIVQSGPAGVIALPANVMILPGNSVAQILVKGLNVGGSVKVTATLPAGLGGAMDSSSVSVIGLRPASKRR